MEADFDDEERSRELEIYASFIHGVLSTIHGIGVMYHFKRSNKIHFMVHLSAMAYSSISTYIHSKYHKVLKRE